MERLAHLVGGEAAPGDWEQPVRAEAERNRGHQWAGASCVHHEFGPAVRNVGPGGGDSVPGPRPAGPFHDSEDIGVGGAAAFALREDNGGVEAAGPEERLRSVEGDSSDREMLAGHQRIGGFGSVSVE